MRDVTKNFAILVSILSYLFALFSACFTHLTIFSANPLDEGRYGGTLRCVMPLLVIKWQNSEDEKGEPLSDTSVTESP